MVVSDSLIQSISLGSGGPTVPPLGIGTWAWGDNLFWTYGQEYGQMQVQSAFHAAVEAGITLFDTAEVYGMGESERLLGRFVQETDRPVQVATKFFPFPWRFNGQAVAKALAASLDRLQLTCVPLYQVHWPFSIMGEKTLMEALARAVEQGKIQAVGVSNYSADQTRTAHQLLTHYGIPLAVNQVRYSLITRKVEQNGIVDTARELGVTILAYCPLAQGLLTGKYTIDNYKAPTGARKLDPRFSPKGLQKLSPLIQLLQEIGEKHDRTPAQVSLNWLIAQGGVIPIPGAKTAEQAKQNAGALGWQLSGDELDALDRTSRSGV